MTYRKGFNKVSELTDFSDKPPESSKTALKGFSVMEDLYITKEPYLESKYHPEAMSIFIVSKGRGKAEFNQRQVDIQENSMIHLGLNSINEVSIEGQSFLISGVNFTSGFIKETEIMTQVGPYISGFFSSGLFLVWELEPEETVMIEHQIRLLADHARKRSVHPYGTEILVHAFCVFLLEVEALRLKHADPSYFPISRKEIHVHRFQNLVQQQFRKVRTIKDYAAKLNISAKYLTEIIKQSTGKNASKIITEQVIKEAKFLLKNPYLSIGEIADQLHFSDPSFFGKYFKRQTGVAPKAYREINADYQKHIFKTFRSKDYRNRSTKSLERRKVPF